ncbi:MAG TPA: peptidoglycan DD-metalloendopeptidase family protein [Clostridia bacterium]|nr:peptidoglycan DD-metalloendopeptidase family protein [Clostridia bacterium]
MKKSFPDEKGTKKGIKEFLDKRGFYIVLLLCIAVVAGTAVYVTTRNAGNTDYNAQDISQGTGEGIAADSSLPDQADELNAQEPEDTQASAAAKQSDIGNPASTDTSGKNAVQPEGSAAAAPKDSTAPAKTTTPAPSKTKTPVPVKRQSFRMPVAGAITLEYAKDKLVYSKTLEEWRAHSGVDIASDRGTPVEAVADGVVTDVSSDQYLGITVVIDHGNDIKSVYRNLASDEAVSVNQKVKQGEIIGSIGNTAMDESSEQPHLHFEVLKKDASVDPMAYLPKADKE